MKKDKLSKCGLRALNDMYIIEEDKMTEYQGSMVIPEAYEFFAKKFPCTGHILSVGDKTKYKLPVGTHVIYARHGVQRYTHEGKELCDVRERDLHCVLL